MSQATYTNPAGRINTIKGEMVAYAAPVEVLGMVGMQREVPKNKGATVIYRAVVPHGGATTNSNTINRWSVDPLTHVLQEGVTPAANTIVYRDITVALQEYGVLYGLSNRAADWSEDDIPADMKKLCGQRIGLLREMIRWGVLKGCTNGFYQGGSSRAAVNGKVSLTKLRKISRNLQANHGKRITSVLSMSYDFGSTGVEASYIVYGHTDLEADIRDLPGFKHVSEYAQRKPISPYEIGSCENFRFVLSPDLGPVIDSGAAVGSTGMVSTGSTYIDVYPMIVMAEDAFGQIALRGDNAIDPTYIAPGQKTKDDPLGQRGYIGAMFTMNCTMLNNGWAAVYEVGATDL